MLLLHLLFLLLCPNTYVMTMQVVFGILFHSLNFLLLVCLSRGVVFSMYNCFALINIEVVCRYWLNLYEGYTVVVHCNLIF